MISIVGPEGGYSCGSGLVVIVTEFRDWQEFLPVVLLIVAICSKVLLECGVGSLRLSIGFWVKCHAEVA